MLFLEFLHSSEDKDSQQSHFEEHNYPKSDKVLNFKNVLFKAG